MPSKAIEIDEGATMHSQQSSTIAFVEQQKHTPAVRLSAHFAVEGRRRRNQDEDGAQADLANKGVANSVWARSVERIDWMSESTKQGYCVANAVILTAFH